MGSLDPQVQAALIAAGVGLITVAVTIFTTWLVIHNSNKAAKRQQTVDNAAQAEQMLVSLNERQEARLSTVEGRLEKAEGKIVTQQAEIDQLKRDGSAKDQKIMDQQRQLGDQQRRIEAGNTFTRELLFFIAQNLPKIAKHLIPRPPHELLDDFPQDDVDDEADAA
jgi:hypothetical protein